MLNFIVYIMVITFFFFLPYKKFFAWLRKYSNIKVLVGGILFIVVNFIYKTVETDTTVLSATTVKGDFLHDAQMNTDAIVGVLGWVLLITGLFMVVASFFLSDKTPHKKN
ncbi:TPA: hypothetical protein U5D50_004256 [Yersinia enterocolitica]|nr:hypothetical protein [Yersinia enterocolitica]